MIDSFHKQIRVCEACNGWGVTLQDKVEDCSSCGGKGVFLTRENKLFIFDMPMFVDFGHRARLKTIKSIILIGILLCILVFFLILFYIIFQVFQGQ